MLQGAAISDVLQELGFSFPLNSDEEVEKLETVVSLNHKARIEYVSLLDGHYFYSD